MKVYTLHWGVVEAMTLLLDILEVLKAEGPLSPGDVAARLRAPRYRVLATFHCLKDLGLIREIYAKGSYKVYEITIYGRYLLEATAETSLSKIMESITEMASSSNGIKLGEKVVEAGTG